MYRRRTRVPSFRTSEISVPLLVWSTLQDSLTLRSTIRGTAGASVRGMCMPAHVHEHTRCMWEFLQQNKRNRDSRKVRGFKTWENSDATWTSPSQDGRFPLLQFLYQLFHAELQVVHTQFLHGLFSLSSIPTFLFQGINGWVRIARLTAGLYSFPQPFTQFVSVYEEHAPKNSCSGTSVVTKLLSAYNPAMPL